MPFRKGNTLRKGKKHSKQTKEKISKANKRKTRKFSSEHRRNISKALKGKKKTKEHVLKIKKIFNTPEKKKEARERMLGNQNWLGKKHTKKTRKKMSLSAKGNTKWLGKKHSKQTLIKMSKSASRRMTKKERARRSRWFRGKKSYNWKGGRKTLSQQIRTCYKYKLWRESIFKRDNYTCKECKERGGYLEAHHYPIYFYQILDKHNIKSLNEALNCEELWSLEGVTLCKKCHNKTKCGNPRNKFQ